MFQGEGKTRPPQQPAAPPGISVGHPRRVKNSITRTRTSTALEQTRRTRRGITAAIDAVSLTLDRLPVVSPGPVCLHLCAPCLPHLSLAMRENDGGFVPPRSLPRGAAFARVQATRNGSARSKSARIERVVRRSMRCAAPLSQHVTKSASSLRRPTSRNMAAAASSSPRLGFLGAGMMAEALAKGFAKAGVAQASDMVATDINAERMAVFAGAPPSRALVQPRSGSSPLLYSCWHRDCRDERGGESACAASDARAARRAHRSLPPGC